MALLLLVFFSLAGNLSAQDSVFQPGDYWINIESDGSVNSVNSAATYTPSPNQYNNFKIVKVFIATEQEYYDLVNQFLESLTVDLAIVVDGKVEKIPQVQANRKVKVDLKNVQGKGERVEIQSLKDISGPVASLSIFE